jgi:hypothetical protein
MVLEKNTPSTIPTGSPLAGLSKPPRRNDLLFSVHTRALIRCKIFNKLVVTFPTGRTSTKWDRPYVPLQIKEAADIGSRLEQGCKTKYKCCCPIKVMWASHNNQLGNHRSSGSWKCEVDTPSSALAWTEPQFDATRVVSCGARVVSDYDALA